jgi:hypothetical protein
MTTDVRQLHNIIFYENSFRRSLFLTCEQTNTAKLMDNFGNFLLRTRLKCYVNVFLKKL